MKQTPRQTAKEILNTSRKLGWDIIVQGSILVIVKSITPGSNESFAQADGEYYDILGRLPSTRPGSVWGTDGGGIGALEAMRTGAFVMKKSGGDKRVLNALKTLNNG